MKAALILAGVSSALASCALPSPSSSPVPETRTFFWGNNFYGQLGFPDNNTVTPKFAYIGSERAPKNSKCFGGFMTSAAILEGATNKVFFAGDSTSGQLGFGAAYEQAFRRFLPPSDALPYLAMDGSNAVPFDLVVEDVCMGWSHTCILVRSASTSISSFRKVMCAGSNLVGQLGVSTFVSNRFQLFQPVLSSRRDSNNLRTDVDFNASVQFKSIHCGGDHTVAVTTDDAVYGWGSNAQGQLGAGAATKVVPLAAPIPLQLAGQSVKLVATGFASTIIVTDSGAVHVMGSNSEGQLGVGATPTMVPTPQPATGMLAFIGRSGIRALSCGGYHCLAIAGGSATDTLAGRLYAWGEGTVGQLGLPVPAGKANSRWYVREPTAVGDLANNALNMIAAGFKHSLVLDNCGDVFAFGSDAFGQLGVGGGNAASNFRSMQPVQIPFVKQAGLLVRYICAGAFHSGLIAAN